MKKTWTAVLLLLLSASLCACTLKGKEPQTSVKCPACGYEFEVPPHGR